MCEDPGPRRGLIEPPDNGWLKKGPEPDPNKSACCGAEIIQNPNDVPRCGKCGRESHPGPVKKY